MPTLSKHNSGIDHCYIIVPAQPRSRYYLPGSLAVNLKEKILYIVGTHAYAEFVFTGIGHLKCIAQPIACTHIAYYISRAAAIDTNLVNIFTVSVGTFISETPAYIVATVVKILGLHNTVG